VTNGLEMRPDAINSEMPHGPLQMRRGAQCANMLLMCSMPTSAKPNKSRGGVKTPAKKMRDYRARLKVMGLKPKQIWV